MVETKKWIREGESTTGEATEKMIEMAAKDMT